MTRDADGARAGGARASRAPGNPRSSRTSRTSRPQSAAKRKPRGLYGTLDEWPLAKKLCAILEVHRDPIARCHFVHIDNKRAQAAYDAVPEAPRVKMSRHIEVAFEIILWVGDAFGFTHFGRGGLICGFHQNLAFHACRRLLEQGFALERVKDVLAAGTTPVELAARFDKPIQQFVEQGGRPPKVSASSLRQITRALESTPIERYARAHHRAVELWCRHAREDATLSLETTRDIGADRFGTLIQLLRKNGRGDRASIIRHAAANNKWPSTGVWVAEQLHDDARRFIRDVLRVGDHQDLEWVLIPFLRLGEITGLRDPLLDVADDLPDQTLKRLVIHARDDFAPLWKDRQALRGRPRGTR